MNEQNQILEQRKLKITGEETIYRHNNTPLFLAWVTLLGFAVFAWYQWRLWLNLVAIAWIMVGGVAGIALIIAGTFAGIMVLLSWGGREAIPVVREAQVIVEKSAFRPVANSSPKSLPNPKNLNKRLPGPPLSQMAAELYGRGK